MPWTSATSVLGALSTAGVPPLSGFWSKLIIILALWQSQYYLYAMLAIVVSVLTLAYMLLMQRKIFFGLPSEASQDVVEAQGGLVAPAVLLAAITAGVRPGRAVCPGFRLKRAGDRDKAWALRL